MDEVASSTAIFVCNNCTAGRYAASAQALCSVCPHGTYAEPSASICASCPAGKYSNKRGAVGCDACPSGKYSDSMPDASQPNVVCLRSACLAGKVHDAEQAVNYDSTITVADEDLGNGQKWMGVVSGPVLPSGKQYVYGIPYEATSPVKVDSATGASTLLASLAEHVGSAGMAWQGGVLAENGCIYGCPRSAGSVFKLNTATDNITMVSSALVDSSPNKWVGAVLSGSGSIYCMPFKATQILKIVPGITASSNDTISMIDIALPSGGVLSSSLSRWAGGVLTPNNMIFAAPFQSGSILKINANDDSASTILLSEMPGTCSGCTSSSSSNKWVGGVRGPTGIIYFIPHTANWILRLDPATELATTINGGLASSAFSSSSWLGAILTSAGTIFAVPYSSSSFLKIDPSTETATLISVPDGLGSSSKKFGGCSMVVSGIVVYLPLMATKVMRLGAAGTCTDCEDNTALGGDAAQFFSPSCSGCAAGSFLDHSQTCSSCEAGMFAGAGAGSCTPCSRGMYQPAEGQTMCEGCAVGKIGSGTQQTSEISACSDCSAGRYTASSGSTHCAACPGGKYQGLAGQGSCVVCSKTCPPGQISTGCKRSNHTADDSDCQVPLHSLSLLTTVALILSAFHTGRLLARFPPHTTELVVGVLRPPSTAVKNTRK
jgi:hypothetical protein